MDESSGNVSMDGYNVFMNKESRNRNDGVIVCEKVFFCVHGGGWYYVLFGIKVGKCFEQHVLKHRQKGLNKDRQLCSGYHRHNTGSTMYVRAT